MGRLDRARRQGERTARRAQGVQDTVQLVKGGAALLIGVIALPVAVLHAYRLRPIGEGRKAKAAVVAGNLDLSEEGSSHTLTVEFADAGGTRHQAEVAVTREMVLGTLNDSKSAIRADATLDVVHDPGDPSRCQVVGYPPPIGMALGMVLVSAVIAVVGGARVGYVFRERARRSAG